MAHSTEITPTDDQISLLPRTEKDEIEEGKKVDHLIDINGQDPLGSQTKKSLNQIFAKKFKDLDNSSIKSHTMFKVNVWLRESNPDSYTPKMVSIGPYHKRDVQLHPMEKYKLLYLRRFLGRKEGLDVESCIKEMEGLKEEALKCYDDVETDEFCLMLLLDGCFVVEFIREYHNMSPNEADKIINTYDYYIIRDLMLLENQLPFFVLNKLHDMTKRDNELALGILASFILLPFFVQLPKMTSGTFLEIAGGNIKHLLHLKHAILCQGNHMPKDDRPRPFESFIEAGGCYNIKNILHLVCRHLCHAGNGKDNDDQTWDMVMLNATELFEAGVSFAKASFETSIFDIIKFQDGLMTIPRFRVTDETETLLRNLIAYEQQSNDVHPKHLSNFVVFMDNLIKSDKDVNLLCQKGIIENWIGVDKEVANLFNKIGNRVPFTNDNFYYTEECIKAIKHCKRPWNKMKAVFFKNALRQASTVAAFIALLFTCIQTILAVTGPLRK